MAYDNDKLSLNAKIFQTKFIFFSFSNNYRLQLYLPKLSPAPYISVGMQNTFV